MTHATNKRITSTAFNRRCKNYALWNNMLQYITTFDVGANCYFLIIAIRVYHVNSQRISYMRITRTALNSRCKNCDLWNNMLQYITTFDVGANCYFLIIAIRVYHVNSQRISCMIIPDFISIYSMKM